MKTALILAALFLVSASSQAQSLLGKQSLKGLQAFEVVIEEVSTNEARPQLKREDLITEAELTLRTAGVRVVTRDETHRTKAGAWIAITVTTIVRPTLKVRAVSISLEVWQRVILVGSSERDVAITYRTPGIVGMVEIDNIDNIHKALKGQIDIFLNDYLAMNPK
jgi:hypothetical protein